MKMTHKLSSIIIFLLFAGCDEKFQICPFDKGLVFNGLACVCGSLQTWNEEQDQCVCVNDDQELDRETMQCKCKDDEMTIINGQCSCQDTKKEVNDQGKCTCKPTYSDNGDGQCGCKDKNATLTQDNQCVCADSNQVMDDETMLCKCKDENATINEDGLCVCIDDTLKMNSNGKCVCKGEYQEIDKDAGRCVCQNNSQRIDVDYKCVCKDPIAQLNGANCDCNNLYQKMDKDTGMCVCQNDDQYINFYGECDCKDPNAQLNGANCVCKDGFFLHEGQCVPDGDNNNNHMYDNYEQKNTNFNNICKKNSDCDSEPNKGDGLCDIYLGYKCTTKCTSDTNCLKESLNDGFNYVCRADGRCAPDEFITLWDIVQAGNTEAEIQFNANCDDDIKVDWGDGSVIENFSSCSLLKHSYKTGHYVVKIKGKLYNWHINSDEKTKSSFAGIQSFGQAGIGIKSFANAQKNFTVSNVDIPDSTLLTSMDRMFYGASNFNQPIGKWDVSNVTSMDRTFGEATLFNQDIGDWDVSNVTNMVGTFTGAHAFNKNIGRWNVSNVTNMESTFNGARAFNQNIGGWKVSNVKNMHAMFHGAEAFNQDIGGWNVANVTNMKEMFKNTKKFNKSLERWNVANVTTIESMFHNSIFDQPLNDWNVAKVTSMSHVFCGNHAFNQPLAKWGDKLSNVKTYNLMFNEASKFEQNLHSWKINEKILDKNALNSMLRGTPICQKNIKSYFPMNYYTEKRQTVCSL